MLLLRKATTLYIQIHQIPILTLTSMYSRNISNKGLEKTERETELYRLLLSTGLSSRRHPEQSIEVGRLEVPVRRRVTLAPTCRFLPRRRRAHQHHRNPTLPAPRRRALLVPRHLGSQLQLHLSAVRIEHRKRFVISGDEVEARPPTPPDVRSAKIRQTLLGGKTKYVKDFGGRAGFL